MMRRFIVSWSLVFSACVEPSPREIKLDDAQFASAVTLRERHRRVAAPMPRATSGSGTFLGGSFDEADVSEAPVVATAHEARTSDVKPGGSFVVAAEYVGGPVDLVRLGFSSSGNAPGRHFELPVESPLRGGVLEVHGDFHPQVEPNKNSSYSAVMQVRRTDGTWSEARTIAAVGVVVEPEQSPVPTGGGSGTSGAGGGTGSTGALARCVDREGVCLQYLRPITGSVDDFRTQCLKEGGDYETTGCTNCGSGPRCRGARLTANRQKYEADICYGASFCVKFNYIDTGGACEEDQSGTAEGPQCTGR